MNVDSADEIEVTTCADSERVFLNLVTNQRRTEPFDFSGIDVRHIGDKVTHLG